MVVPRLALELNNSCVADSEPDFYHCEPGSPVESVKRLIRIRKKIRIQDFKVTKNVREQ